MDDQFLIHLSKSSSMGRDKIRKKFEQFWLRSQWKFKDERLIDCQVDDLFTHQSLRVSM